MKRYTHLRSPLGPVLVTSENDLLTRLFLDCDASPDGADWVEDADSFAEVARQLDAYWRGDLTTFDIPMDPPGTEFQKQVWAALTDIPYGTTVTYGAIADKIGKPRAVRAVGRANGSNPIAVIVPCHRVIGANGSLTGYAGGVDKKAKLLEMEGRFSPRDLVT
jgi:methylated-DNA-[protein]-cysteine S-methyltransferase